MSKLPERLNILMNEYPGDEAWETFVSCFPEIAQGLTSQVPIESDCVRALYWKNGNSMDRVRRWLDASVPALDNRTPKEVSKFKEGKILLRTAIMRMP